MRLQDDQIDALKLDIANLGIPTVASRIGVDKSTLVRLIASQNVFRGTYALTVEYLRNRVAP